VLWQLEQQGSYEDVRGTPDDLVIAVEESHGILLTPKIRDKDAGAAALLMAELALAQKRRNRTVLDYLEELARQFGHFRHEAVPLVMPGIQGRQDMARILDGLRAAPPRSIAGLEVTSFEDLREEGGRLGPIKGATDAAARNFLIFRCGDRARVVLRPSGTEPKAKIYVETCSAPSSAGTSGEKWRGNCHEVDELAGRLAEDFVQKAKATLHIRH
jgi:phosphoglucomutase